jgi:hypothetical protein
LIERVMGYPLTRLLLQIARDALAASATTSVPAPARDAAAASVADGSQSLTVPGGAPASTVTGGAQL